MRGKGSNPDFLRWLKAAIDDKPTKVRGVTKADLRGLTGQDLRALTAIAACWKLIANSDSDGEGGGLTAIASLLPSLQRQFWPVAREIIPWAMDWGHRDRYWPAVGDRLGDAGFWRTVDADTVNLPVYVHTPTEGYRLMSPHQAAKMSLRKFETTPSQRIRSVFDDYLKDFGTGDGHDHDAFVDVVVMELHGVGDGIDLRRVYQRLSAAPKRKDLVHWLPSNEESFPCGLHSRSGASFVSPAKGQPASTWQDEITCAGCRAEYAPSSDDDEPEFFCLGMDRDGPEPCDEDGEPIVERQR